MDESHEKKLTHEYSTATKRAVMFTSVLASSMAFIDATALNVILPAIQSSLSATGSDLLWVLNAYALVLAALLIVGGSLGDRYGRKRIFMLGIAVFSVASLLCGLSHSIQLLIASRLLQGVGGALMIPGSLAMLAEFYGPEQRGKAIATWTLYSVITSSLGPILGGALAQLLF